MTHDDDRHRTGIERMLGPVGDDIGCDACFDLLDEFVELELSGRDADAAIPGLKAHLGGCPACREEHDSLYAFVVRAPDTQ